MSAARKYISLLLFAMIAFAIMPRELIHEFCHDAHEEICPGSSDHSGIHQSHKHCALFEMKFHLAQKSSFSHQLQSFELILVFEKEFVSFFQKNTPLSQFLRGPPEVV